MQRRGKEERVVRVKCFVTEGEVTGTGKQKADLEMKTKEEQK